ncbi:hypothetical protein LTS08_006604 [Lithohypha guttulata]|uniref:Uncharacterized protein n=1 Tax=Lithohypha guttulata TaxID=1690604 RepID=A0ABR0K110_9EURO|nr:hypothetical protein LTR24_008230 [Lithohypha guttulata]KAK5097849.1 hypothetical protein LTS08_006604 [Lithohypha guttulata]
MGRSWPFSQSRHTEPDETQSTHLFTNAVHSQTSGNNARLANAEMNAEGQQFTWTTSSKPYSCPLTVRLKSAQSITTNHDDRLKSSQQRWSSNPPSVPSPSRSTCFAPVDATPNLARSQLLSDASVALNTSRPVLNHPFSSPGHDEGYQSRSAVYGFDVSDIVSHKSWFLDDSDAEVDNQDKAPTNAIPSVIELLESSLSEQEIVGKLVNEVYASPSGCKSGEPFEHNFIASEHSHPPEEYTRLGKRTRSPKNHRDPSKLRRHYSRESEGCQLTAAYSASPLCGAAETASRLIPFRSSSWRHIDAPKETGYEKVFGTSALEGVESQRKHCGPPQLSCPPVVDYAQESTGRCLSTGRRLDSAPLPEKLCHLMPACMRTSPVTLPWALSPYEKAMQILLDAGGDVNAEGGEYGNALQAASARGLHMMVQRLLDAGAHVNTQGGWYGSALQSASAGGHEKVVQLLLDAGADVNAQGGEYGDALQAALARGHEKVVQILLRQRANARPEQTTSGKRRPRRQPRDELTIAIPIAGLAVGKRRTDPKIVQEPEPYTATSPSFHLLASYRNRDSVESSLSR